MQIHGVGMVDVTVYVKDQSLYLPVNSLFSFLHIQNTASPGYDTVSGFFIRKEATYLIDRALNRIQYQGKTYNVKPGDLLRTETNLFLDSKYLGEIFGLICRFDFRSMSATMETKDELPIIREMRLELMRKNISRLKAEVKPDTLIRRRYPLFKFGMADWAVAASQEVKGSSSTSLNLALGANILGGETNISLNYSTNRKFSEKQQYYYWHYANNDLKLLKQVRLGKITSGGTASIMASLLGVQLTNSPTTYRRSFGTYTLTEYTDPGWTVELYVNSVLVDYKKADASGFVTFEVPLIYGTSSVMLRYYGPWGEERFKQQSINIPFNFLPKGKLEYNVTAAMVQDSAHSIFSRANFGYGLGTRLTIGGGTEYLSSLRGSKFIPFVNMSIRIASSMLLSGEYTYGVRYKGALNFGLPLDIHVEMSYTKFQRDQKAVMTTFDEERRAVISVPIRGRNYSFLCRLTADQIFMRNSRNLTTELLISGSVFGISTNLTTNAIFFNSLKPVVFSSLSLGFRLPGQLLITPQTQFDYNMAKFISVKVEAEKKVFSKGVVKLSYEHNILANAWNVQAGFRYDLPFAQTGFSAVTGSSKTTFYETARGSLMFDPARRWVGTGTTTAVGKGGFVVAAFLDLNWNGVRDPDEPKIPGLNLHLTGGRVERNKRDSTIRVMDLEPFTNYFIDIDRSSFENVAWRIKNATISAAVDPNMFKLIMVPVTVMGEASGMIYRETSGGLIGKGKITAIFYRNDTIPVGRTLSEPDGYFSFMGFSPGHYTVKMDPKQMDRLKMKAEPDTLHFEIRRTMDGDQISGLNFTLRYTASDTTGSSGDSLPEALTEVFPPLQNDSLNREPITRGEVEPNVTPDLIRLSPRDSVAGKIIPMPVVAGADTTVKAGERVPATDSLRYRKDVSTSAQANIPDGQMKRPDIPDGQIKQPDIPDGQMKQPEKPVGRIIPVVPVVTELTGDCAGGLQVGAFHIKANADRSLARVSSMLKMQVVMVPEDRYYKVRVPGLNSSEDLKAAGPELRKNGYFDSFLVRGDCIFLQVGAYHVEANARRAQVRASGELGKTAIIVNENGFMKVRIKGFTGMEEAQRFYFKVRELGFSDAFIVTRW